MTILYTPSIVRAESLDKLSSVLKYNKRVIVVDPNGDFIGFAQYKRFEPDFNYYFTSTQKVIVGGVKLLDKGLLWFKSGGKELYPQWELLISVTKDNRLID